MKSTVVIWSAFLIANPLFGADWPQFRGPSADGVGNDPKVPLEWAPDKNVIWKTELPGPGSSSPIVSQGKIFLTSYSGYGVSDKEPGDPANLKRHAICVDRSSGKILWEHAVATPSPDQAYEGRYITQHGYA